LFSIIGKTEALRGEAVHGVISPLLGQAASAVVSLLHVHAKV
jgi:hypothetical protein